MSDTDKPTQAAPVQGPVSASATIRASVEEQVASIPPAMPTLAGGALPNVSPPSMPDRYVLQGEIARGGMGRVVEALDTVLGRIVALKEALSFDADSLARFQRETKITARLEHPSIVPVHDGGTTSDGMPYYVMRKISGVALESLVAKHGELELRLGLIPHLVHAAQAVAHAHERGIVHRDIKPSNILVGDLGETMVIDWGLAKVIGESDEASGAAPDIVADDEKIHTRVGIVFGTPGFMAPEQLRGNPVDERCDVYALGATLYHLLARRPPHHNKNADEMMRAAVNGPPTPIREVAEGVPAELATIVDKALAHDATERYQNARALAEDLNRFLTGQLVASHHYTRGEKLRRFVKKNLPTLVAAGIGILALLVIGTIAIIRVVDARDRAEHERMVAVQRADQLALNQARILVDTDPTRAVALLRPLAATHWREARAIAVAARAAGVPWSYPAAPTTGSIAFAKDGTHALLAGSDGLVRELDLVTHATRTVLDAKVPVHARYGDADRIVGFFGSTIAIVDHANRRDVTVATPIADLEVTEGFAYWVDEAESLWRLDLAGDKPEEIVLSEQVTALAPSPDGRWVALAGVQHLMVLDRKATEPAVVVTIGIAHDLAWASDGLHLAALVDDRAVEVTVSRDSLIVSQRMALGERYGTRFLDDKLYTVGKTGVHAIVQGELELRKQLVGSEAGLGEARRGTLVAPTATGTIFALSKDGDRVIAPPFTGLALVATSPSSPYIIGAYANRVLVWNLDDIEPTHATEKLPSTAAFVDGDHAIATFQGAPPQWIDLATHAAVVLDGAPPVARAIVAAPDGKLAAMIDVAHTATLVAPSAAPIPLGPADRAGFVDEHHLAIAAGDKIRIVDTRTKAALDLATPSGTPLQLAWSRPDRLAATYATSLWRYDMTTGRGETIALPTGTTPTTPPAILGDGTVLVGIEKQLHAWAPSSTALVSRATFPSKIVELAPSGGNAVAFDSDGGTYVVDGSSDAIVASDHPLGPTASMAATAGLIVSLTPDNGIELHDPVARQHWLLAPASVALFLSPRISADGNRVIATTPGSPEVPGRLLVWTLKLPRDAGETVTYLDTLTNAHAEAGAELTWR